MTLRRYGAGLASVVAVVGLAADGAGEARAETAVLLAAGDIASCSSDGDEQTAALLDAQGGTVAALGDLAYEAGTAQEFADCYQPSWGRHKARTRPTPGNHEYGTPGAAGYYGYFGALAGDPSRGYYSYELGNWHVVVLNSNCAEIGGCHTGSVQEQWLRLDLATHPADCTVAYWHNPRFSSGARGPDTAFQAFWQALYDQGADLVLVAHDHHYERFAPQRPDGAADSRGIRQFIVGTGGRSFQLLAPTPAPNSEVRQNTTFGILRLVLEPTTFSWQFLPVAGGTFTDSGSARCYETTPPQTSIDSGPSGETQSTTATFAFSASEPGSSFACSLGGSPFTACTSPATYGGLSPGARTFRVRATDPGGNTDATPAERTWTISSGPAGPSPNPADVTPPETTIESGPTGTVAQSAASFRFSASEPVSRFECALGSGSMTACASPTSYRGLKAGRRLFRVRAVDRAGNVDPSPAKRTWTVAATTSRRTARVGSARADVLRGTAGPDLLRGRGGDDVALGLAGADILLGGTGRDRLLGGAGADVLRAADGYRDRVVCGGGRDTVFADRRDRVAADCERVVRLRDR